MLIISAVQSGQDWLAARRLFEEYAASLSYNLCFQGFSKELEEIESIYGPPGGALLLARFDGQPQGCVGLRPREVGTCEMKRLYLRPDYRRGGNGRTMALAIIDEARRLGYERMRLDTLPTMQAAIPLYRSLGFREIEPYYENPIEGTLYMELDLAAPSS